ACTRSTAGYVKDLSKLGRDLRDVIIVDNSPVCYALQPENAIPIKTWRGDEADRALFDLIPILHALANVDSIPDILRTFMEGEVNDEETAHREEHAGRQEDLLPVGREYKRTIL
ncbi:unnamed protein product, partial [Prorocentrum cordatum]